MLISVLISIVLSSLFSDNKPQNIKENKIILLPKTVLILNEGTIYFQKFNPETFLNLNYYVKTDTLSGNYNDFENPNEKNFCISLKTTIQLDSTTIDLLSPLMEGKIKYNAYSKSFRKKRGFFIKEENKITEVNHQNLYKKLYQRLTSVNFTHFNKEFN